jgi:hypothetical protein
VTAANPPKPTPPTPSPAPKPALVSNPPTSEAPPTLVSATPGPPALTPAPPPPKLVREPLDPYGPDARVAEPGPTAVNATSGDHSFVRGRVVVHTVPEPTGGYAGAGTTATQALYAVLQRRLHMSVVPMGVGMTTLAAAAEEGQRARAALVLMARVDALTFALDPAGTTIARLRLELAVVREGRTVLRRTVLTETPPTGPAGIDRHGRVDPVYLAMTHALDGMLGDLATALAATPGDAR